MWIPKDIVQQMLLLNGTKGGKDLPCLCQEGPWGWVARGVWGHREQVKGIVSKDREVSWKKKKNGFIHIFVQSQARPTHFLPPSLHPPLLLYWSCYFFLLLFPSCVLGHHSYMYCLGYRGNSESQLLNRCRLPLVWHSNTWGSGGKAKNQRKWPQ